MIQTGESIITILPDSKFRISCTQVGPGGRFTQYLSAEITPDFYEKEIATARTFVFYEDVKPLMDKGLIKGGSIENAIVARGDSVLSKEPLRFSDEFVRHKILDIIGDLILSGRRLRGHVVAVKPGHLPEYRGCPFARQAQFGIPGHGPASDRRGCRRARHQRNHAHPAPPLPVPDGGPNR